MKLTAEKNKKQRSSYLPISIGWVLKIVLIMVGLYLFYDVIRGILSCLLMLGAVITLIYLMLTYL